MTRDDLLRKVAGLACASLFDVKERLANDIDTHDASQRALTEQQAKEIKFHTGRVEALRRFLSEKITECQKQAKEIARLRKFAATFLDRMNKFGQWEDGCFYYNRTCASELKEVIDMAKTLKEEHP